MKLLVGIDGGGTKTDFIVCESSGKVRQRFQKGPSNPVDIGIGESMKVLQSGVEEIYHSFPEAEIISVYAGMAGGITGKHKELIHRGLLQLFPESTCIGNHTDAMNQMLYECEGRDAGAVVAGTGIVGLSKKGDDISLFGGYGYLLDRGGSGYDYGRDALYYALCDADGRRKKTLIREMIEEQVGDIRKHIPQIYEKGKPYIASFAPLVFEAYRQKDEVAGYIIEKNAKETANLMNAIAQHQETEVCKIVLSGSVFKSFDIIQEFLQKFLISDFQFVLSKVAPVYGAVMQAAVQIGVLDREDFKKNLK